MVAGSFVLTPATAIRYEKHDRKVRQLTREEELEVRKNPRKVDWRDEYQVSSFLDTRTKAKTKAFDLIDSAVSGAERSVV